MLSADARSKLFAFLQKIPLVHAVAIVAATGLAVWVINQNATEPVVIDVSPAPVIVMPPDVPGDGGHGDGQPRIDPPALPDEPPEDVDEIEVEVEVDDSMGRGDHKRLRRLRSLPALVA